MPLHPIPLADADLRFDPHWLDGQAAHSLYEDLRATLAWSRHAVRLFGRELPAPRLSCWIGDPGASYRYSGIVREPHPWPDVLRPIRARLCDELGVDFDSVLANLYRDGADSMGWHADDEPGLGVEPVIASLSLGAARVFRLRHRQGDSRHAIELTHGSLLVMAGPTQACYQHAMPKTARPVGPRLNLTFRRIHRGH